MLNPMKLSLAAAVFAAGSLLSPSTQAGTIVGTASLSDADGRAVVEKVHYRPYKHYHKKRFHRRHVYGYPYRRAYRPYYRPYYDDDDHFVYRRPAVRFGLGVKKYRYDDDDDY